MLSDICRVAGQWWKGDRIEKNTGPLSQEQYRIQINCIQIFHPCDKYIVEDDIILSTKTHSST